MMIGRVLYNVNTEVYDLDGYGKLMPLRPAAWRYTLPTEAQWEYACRAGTTTMYFFGDAPSHLSDYGWYGENSDGRTHAVGTRKPNPWGLYDRGGNVYQWRLDGYAPYSSDASTDPQHGGASDARILRGGSWHCTPKQCRSAFRWLAADGHYNNGGLRVCLLLDLCGPRGTKGGEEKGISWIYYIRWPLFPSPFSLPWEDVDAGMKRAQGR